MTRFEEFCQRQRWKYGEDFVPPKGDDLIRAYNKGPGWRVWILDSDGFWKWGTVGLSCGWAPTFILIHNARSMGGCAIDESNTIAYGRMKGERTPRGLTTSREVLPSGQEVTA